MDGIIWRRRAGLASFAVAVLAVLLHPSLVAAGAPKVVKAEPDNGQEQVDPATKHIRIEFDQPMDTLHGYSIVGGGEQFPRMIGKPRWQGDRTIIISVKLEPDHDYRLSINSSKFTGFRGRSGEAAEPYPIAFSTAASHASGHVAAAGSRDENQRAFEELRRAILTDYAYRDRMNIDWANVLDGARTRLEEAATPAEFARRAAKVLAPAQDMHLWLKVDGRLVSTTMRSVSPNYSLATLGKEVPGWTRRGNGVFTGRYPDGIGYVFIDSWSLDRAEGVRAAIGFLQELQDVPGLIVDVRANAGGAEPLARELAGCFVGEPVVYGKHRTMAGGTLSDIQQRILEPHRDGVRYRGKVVVLMGPANMSSCESFLKMMQQVPACRLVGEKSWGSSGNPHEIDLGNGVSVFVPSWQDLNMDGTTFEGKGIEPNVRVTAAGGFARRDPILEAGLKELRGDRAENRTAAHQAR